MKLKQLVEAQRRLNEGLYAKFGPCPADHDDDYVFYMTFAIGWAGFEAYRKAYDVLIKLGYKKYYFCYKVCNLSC